MAGCNAGATRDAIVYAEKARDLGYDAIMLAAPYTSLPTQRELAAHYEAIADAAGLPVILYNYPARAGVEIGFDCLDAIVDRPDIVGIKESSGDFSRFLALRRRYGDRITIMCGSDDQAVDYFSWGVRSWLAGTSNVLPRHHAAIMDAANSGDHATAYRLFDGILAWVQLMESGLVQPEGQARPGAPGPADRRRPPAAAAARGRRRGGADRRARRRARGLARARLMRVARTLTGLEVHAEGEQGTCFLGGVFDVPGATMRGEAAVPERGRRLAAAVPLPRAARPRAVEREPRVPVHG